MQNHIAQEVAVLHNLYDTINESIHRKTWVKAWELFLSPTTGLRSVLTAEDFQDILI